MKKIVISSILIGVLISLLFYFNYKKNSSVAMISDDEVYFLQVGAYEKKENVINITKSLPSYLVIEEDKIFHVYVGITINLENVKKIKAFYEEKGHNIYVRMMSVNNKDFLKKIYIYDEMIESTDNYGSIHTINREVLKIYNEYENK